MAIISCCSFQWNFPRNFSQSYSWLTLTHNPLHPCCLLHVDRRPQPEPSCFPALNTQNRRPERTHPYGPGPSAARWLSAHLYGIPGQTAAPAPPCFRKLRKKSSDANTPTCPQMYYTTHTPVHWKDVQQARRPKHVKFGLFVTNEWECSLVIVVPTIKWSPFITPCCYSVLEIYVYKTVRMYPSGLVEIIF